MQSQRSNSCCAPPLPRQFGMEEAGLVPVGQSSLKAALDHAWGEPTARERTLRVVLEEVERWKSWREQQQRLATQAPSLQEMMGTLGQRVAQDTEPDPEGEPGGRHITKWMERANVSLLSIFETGVTFRKVNTNNTYSLKIVTVP